MSDLPYEPRRRSVRRPERALPPPPPDEVATPTGIAVGATDDDVTVSVSNALDYAQGYTSPPSPPSAPVAAPPPPSLDALSLRDIPEATGGIGTGTETETGNGEATGAPKRVRPPVPKTNAQTAAAHLNPFHSTLPSSELVPPTTLTPLRAHYFKKALVSRQIAYELNLITDPVLGANALGLLGSPFVLPEAAKQHISSRAGADLELGEVGDLPFMRYLFHQFLLPFPFLAAAPPSFWHAKVQPFLSSFLATTGVSAHSTMSDEERDIAESLMTKDEKKEAEERKKLWSKAEKHLGLMIAVGVKLTGGEEVVRIGQSELRRIEAAAQERKRKWQERNPTAGQDVIFFDVNVVGVRNVVERGRVRSKSHEEFFIRTQRTGVADVFVSRRYGDFRRLAEELRAHFPDIQIPNPPAKDKTVTTAPATPSNQQSYGSTLSAYNPLRAIYGSSPTPSGSSTPKGNASPTPGSAPTFEGAEPDAPGPLSRERNRLTLRAYLQSILAIPQVANSPVMRSFLLSHPVTLTPPEALDIQRRLEADAVREEGRKRFKEEAERRVEALRVGLAQFKGDVLSREGGLKSVFDVVRRVEKVEDLPPAEKSVLEWGRISLAATIFQTYVASDTASESLASLKRLHGMTPYFILKGILKISNPMAMIRGVLDLFLARPFGGQSLLQRMFSTSLSEDVRYLTEDIAAVQDKIDDPIICQKIEQYANAPFEIQEMLRRDALAENTDLLVVILRSQEMPVLSRPQIQRVFRASRAYKEYKAWQAELEDSDDDDGPTNDDAWLFEDLNILLKLMARKKEKEAMIALIFEGVTAELLKDIITIFYSPLAQVYKAASIADSLGDLQAFINDMIRTIEQVEELAQEDPQRTVQTFIDLVQRHEQAFYTFVHNVHSKGQGLFDSLMGWIELFLSYAREGLAGKLDLEVLLPHDGPERVALMKEVDAIAQYHYKLKVAHEEKIRRRFQSGGVDQQELEEAALVDSVMASLSIGSTAVGAAGEIAVEESEEDTTDESDTETSSVMSGSTNSGSVRRSSLQAPSDSGSVRRLSLQAPSDSGSVRRSSIQAPSDSGSVRRSSLQAPSDSGSVRRSSIQNPHGSSPLVPAEHKALPPGPQGEDLPPPPPPKDLPKPPGHKKRRRKPKNVLVAPETPLIDELRPLFVEVVKPMLVVKPLQTQ